MQPVARALQPQEGRVGRAYCGLVCLLSLVLGLIRGMTREDKTSTKEEEAVPEKERKRTDRQTDRQTQEEGAQQPLAIQLDGTEGSYQAAQRLWEAVLAVVVQDLWGTQETPTS